MARSMASMSPVDDIFLEVFMKAVGDALRSRA